MKKILFVFLLQATIVYSQNYNVELLSNVRFTDECSNIWGYAANGKEYAIIGRLTGTSIFDITDAKNPKLLRFIPGARSQWREIKTWKDRVYVVADQGQDGLLIINMSKAPEISFVFYRPMVTINDPVLNIHKTDFLNRAHTLYIDEKGFCYLNGGNLHFGVAMFDLNKNPDSPEFTGIFNPSYAHDAFARHDTFWSADIIAGEFTVWNLKDKKNPVKLTSQQTGFAFTHNIWLSDDGHYAFTTDERANAFVEAYDVSNLNNITLVDKYRSRTTKVRGTIPHNTHYHNNFLVTSYYTDGFTIVDASNPAHLVEVGAYDTYPAGEEDFHGCWGVYPYLPSGNIIASDIEFGLFVFKPNYKKAGYLKGVVKDSITGIVLDNVKIKIDLVPFNEVLTTANGSFKTGGPYTGEVTIELSKDGYRAKKMKVNLQTGQVTEANILLQPLENGEVRIKVIDAVTKQGIPGVNIQFVRPEVKFIVNTDANGNSVNLINEGNWMMHLGAWGYKFESLPLVVTTVNQLLTIELTKRYEDNFLFDLGWTATSTAFRGIWGRVEPRGAYIREKAINPDFDLPDDVGDQCMVTGNGSTAATADDVDGGYSRLISPPMNLTDYKQPVLSFYAWTVRMNLFDTIPSAGTHKVYLASGNDTILIDTLTPNNPSWKKYSLNIDPTKIKNKNNVHILFEAFEPVNIDTRNIIEFAVDGFLLTDGTVTANKEETSTNSLYKAYPSPFINRITIEGPALPYDQQVDVMDSYGRKVKSFTWKRMQTKWIVESNLPSGLYFISVAGINKLNGSLKVVCIQ